MNSIFAPTPKNNYKAYLMKTPVLLVFILIISLFNFFVKVDTQAQTLTGAINIQSLLDAHNVERLKVGKNPLSLDSKLASSAQAKAVKMIESNCWSHYCPDGQSPWSFFEAAQYEYILAGENLAEGYYYIDDLINAWMNSETHRDNILNGDYEEVGFGIVSAAYQGIQNNILVVVHFGSEMDNIVNNDTELTITSPLNESIFNKSEVRIEGVASGVNSVNILLNGSENGKADINQGLFTYNLKLEKEGDNYIYAQAPMTLGISKDSNVIKVIFDKPEPIVAEEGSVENNDANPSASAAIPIAGNLNNITASPEFKNYINLGFIAALALLFLIDFIVLSRTKMIKRERSFSHYHFGLFFILAIIILAGGFGGDLIDAINI